MTHSITVGAPDTTNFAAVDDINAAQQVTFGGDIPGSHNSVGMRGRSVAGDPITTDAHGSFVDGNGNPVLVTQPMGSPALVTVNGIPLNIEQALASKAIFKVEPGQTPQPAQAEPKQTQAEPEKAQEAIYNDDITTPEGMQNASDFSADLVDEVEKALPNMAEGMTGADFVETLSDNLMDTNTPEEFDAVIDTFAEQVGSKIITTVSDRMVSSLQATAPAIASQYQVTEAQLQAHAAADAIGLSKAGVQLLRGDIQPLRAWVQAARG